LTRKVKSKCLLPSYEKWELQYTHMFRTFTLRTKRSKCICVYVKSAWCSCIKWENNFDCSSRQTHLIVSLMKGCVVENNKRVERKWWQRVCSFIYEETTTTTIINSFTVCLLCLSENHHHHYNHYSTLIIFKRKPSAMQMLVSLNTC
jgi:hypothetical protein